VDLRTDCSGADVDQRGSFQFGRSGIAEPGRQTMRPQKVDGRLTDAGQEWGPFGAPAIATAYAGCVPAEFRLKPSSSMLTDADGQGNVRADTVSGQQMLVPTLGGDRAPGPVAVACRARGTQSLATHTVNDVAPAPLRRRRTAGSSAQRSLGFGSGGRTA
jgi:hypothetical protein